MSKMNGYELSRQWFDFSFENTSKVRPIHTAVYLFAVERCNRLGWKKEFGFPTSLAMDAIGVRSKNTYLKALHDLIDWGFLEMVEESKNQYSANIIAISKIDTAQYTALDTATKQHGAQHLNASDTIDKPLNQETIKPRNNAREGLTIPEKIQQADTVQALSEIWFSVLRERNLNPGLSQQEMVQHEMFKWGLDKSKKIISEAVKCGWKNLKEEYLSEQQKQSNNRIPGTRAHVKIHYN